MKIEGTKEMKEMKKIKTRGDLKKHFPHIPTVREEMRRNLIRMLEAIAEDINAKLRKRQKPSERNNRNKGDKAGLRNALKVPKRHDLLSIDQFNAVLARLEPDAKPREGEGCGFDIYALLLATNLFSLFTMRDGRMPVNDSRRTVPQQIICHPGTEARYMRWWQKNRGHVAGDSAQSPRPAWLSRLQAETGQTDPHP